MQETTVEAIEKETSCKIILDAQGSSFSLSIEVVNFVIMSKNLNLNETNGKTSMTS